MNETHNKITVIIAMLVIAISLLGLFIGKGKITGMAIEENESGNITVTVVADVDINGTDRLIAFGNLKNDMVNKSEDEGIMDNLTIINLGNSIVDIDHWANSSLFGKINGTTEVTNGGAVWDDSYKIRILNAGGCGTTDISTYTNVSIGFGNATSLIRDCDTNEQFTVGIQVYVPHYEDSGTKSSTIYFRATEH